MNERIRQLAEQATTIEYGADRGFDRVTFDKEKFAELIVRECDHLIQQQVSLKYKDGWEQSGVSDDWAYGHYSASTLSRTIIKQHFGVER